VVNGSKGGPQAGGHVRRALQTLNQKSFLEDFVNLWQSMPQKGSKNEETALRTRKRYPHEGSSVARLLGRIQKFVLGTSYVHIDSRFDLEVVRIVHP